MNIAENVKEAEAKLSRVNVDFLEFVRDNPETLNRSNFKLLELNDKLFTLQPWPTFVNRENRNRFREVSLKMWELLKSIPRRVFGYDFEKMSRFYELPVQTIKLQFEGVDVSHLENLVGRGDFILSAVGLKCLEYNFSAGLGGWQVPIWESLYLNNPLIGRFFKEYGVKTIADNLILQFLEHVVQSVSKEISNRGGKLNTAIVSAGLGEDTNSTQSYLNLLYKDALRQKNAALQGKVHMCDYPDLDIADGFVFHKGEKIHTLVEFYMGSVPPGIMEVFKAGNIRIMNGPITNIMSSKLNLALLSDHESTDVFTREEREFIDRHVPWTRKIAPVASSIEGNTIRLVDYILSNREKLVIKPGSDYGGKGVCVGIKATEHQWKESVETALCEKNWVAQEFVESSPGLYQSGATGYDIHDMSWGFFVFGSRYAGVWVRVLPRKNNKGVINCHQGASVSVVFNVNE
jgi:hypothetical protein